MNQYKVTWGDEEATVYAANEGDAWSAFAEKHDLAIKHPNAHERAIELLSEPENKSAAPTEDVALASPVADSNAEEAIDAIHRMRSVEKLQQIVDADGRVTVVQAAKDRITEIGTV